MNSAIMKGSVQILIFSLSLFAIPFSIFAGNDAKNFSANGESVSAAHSNLCQLLIEMNGHPNPRIRDAKQSEIIALVQKYSTSVEGLEFLREHLNEFRDAQFLPPAWDPLATLPEYVVAVLRLKSGLEAFETISLLLQLESAKDPHPRNAGFRLAAQQFLSSFLARAQSALVSIPPCAGRSRVEAFVKLIGMSMGEWDLHSPYPALIRSATQSNDSQPYISAFALLAQGESGLKRLFERTETPSTQNLLPPDWTNPFMLRPARTPLLLSQQDAAGHFAPIVIFESLAVLRMIHFATTTERSEEAFALKNYARAWLRILFSVSLPTAKSALNDLQSPYTAQGIVLLENLRKFAESKGALGTTLASSD